MTSRMTSTHLARASALTLAICALGGCSSITEFAGGDRIDYKSESSKANPLEVPPDLTPLVQDQRYLPQGGSVSANSLAQGGTASAPAGQQVAIQQTSTMRIERQGAVRVLVVAAAPESLWQPVRQFWQDRGFVIASDSAAAGIIETDWAENRAKIPQDVIRNSIGKVLDSFYSTGERDKFRTRLERRADGGTEITLVHQGLEEVVTGHDGSTVWTNRAPDPTLEGEMLSRLMVALGAREDAARAAVADTAPEASAPAGAATAPRARLVAGAPAATLQLDDTVESAWRRVGLALDRGSFTVEDRDRAQGVYFVRLADPNTTSASERGFFDRISGWFSSDSKTTDTGAVARWRVKVSADGDARSLVTVQNANGEPDNSAPAQRIATLLLDGLK